jgi:hypothetical protein
LSQNCYKEKLLNLESSSATYHRLIVNISLISLDMRVSGAMNGENAGLGYSSSLPSGGRLSRRWEFPSPVSHIHLRAPIKEQGKAP